MTGVDRIRGNCAAFYCIPIRQEYMTLDLAELECFYLIQRAGPWLIFYS